MKRNRKDRNILAKFTLRVNLNKFINKYLEEKKTRVDIMWQEKDTHRNELKNK